MKSFVVRLTLVREPRSQEYGMDRPRTGVGDAESHFRTVFSFLSRSVVYHFGLEPVRGLCWEKAQQAAERLKRESLATHGER
jgi:hypothetical protein